LRNSAMLQIHSDLPLFAAKGDKKIYDDDTEFTTVVFIHNSYDAALKQATELLYQHYINVSAERIDM
jgi:hypothetical protein